MVFNKALPSGQKAIALLDDDVRKNNDALQPAFNQEHDFVDNDGVQQTGYHTFPIGDAATFNDGRNVDGGLLIDNIIDPDGTLYWRNGGSWVPFRSGDPNVPKVNQNSEYTASQWGVVEALVGTATVTLDPTTSAYKYVQLTQATTLAISAVPGDLVGSSTTLSLDLDQGPTGGYAITFDPSTPFRAQGGAVQIATGANERTKLQFEYTQDGLWLVTSLPNWNVGGVVAVGAI